MIGRVSARSLNIQREAAQKGDMRHTYADTSLARQDLGFAPRVGLEEGLAAEFTWLSGVL
jgi:nucleoside-diphosphate-sugar epimerase